MTICIYLCRFSVISMHIRRKVNDDKILTWIHPFPIGTLIGTNELAAVCLPACGCLCCQCEMDSPGAAGGGWCAVMALVCPNQCICHENYELLWTISKNKERIRLSLCKRESTSLKANQMQCLKLSYWTGGWDTAQKLFMVEKPKMNIVLWIHGITALSWWELTLYLV